MKSKILPYDVNYCIYLPPGYEESTRRFPVVYLLHGYSDREWGWVQFGEIQEAVDQAILSRKIPPMIIVMPDGKVSFYVNDYRGKEKYEDMFIQELIPHIDSAYRTRPQQEYRGIAGLSMGGYGALTLSLRHVDLFSGCAAFSAAVWEDEAISDPKSYERYFKDIFGPLKEGNLPEHFKKYNPLDIVRTSEPDVLTKVRYYIDCGDDDFLIAGNCALHLLMTEKKIPHEFRVRDGGHRWIYWRTGIIDGLEFIAQRFHR
ncbi:MAG: esterase family protein [Candidatus Aminicenantes bacterium]|nr:esterase family protein [Candidatus Aminicenantes bacterium]